MKTTKLIILLTIIPLALITCSKDEDKRPDPTHECYFFADNTEYELNKGMIDFIGLSQNGKGFEFNIALYSSGIQNDSTTFEGNGNFVFLWISSVTLHDIQPGIYTYDNSSEPFCINGIARTFNGVFSMDFNTETWNGSALYVPTSGTIEVDTSENGYELTFDIIANNTTKSNQIIESGIKITGYYKGDLLQLNFLAERQENCNFDVDTLDFSFGIDYDSPEKYLVPGTQSNLSDTYLGEVRAALGGPPENNLNGILSVCHWVNQNFNHQDAGGAMAGKNTVNELFAIKTFYGCHTQALIISSILRKFGFPAVMIETASVQWGFEHNAGIDEYFAGHVMSEIYVDDKWILFDNNCTYVEEYDNMNPFIPTTNPHHKDLFVLAKGFDTWDYYEKAGAETDEMMMEFADNIYCYADLLNTVKYTWND